MNLRRIWRRIRARSAGSRLLQARDMVVRMWIVEPWIVTVINITLFILLPILVLLLANAMHACAGIDGVVYSPVMTFASICERSSDLFKARVQREVMANGVLAQGVSGGTPVEVQPNIPSSLKGRI